MKNICVLGSMNMDLLLRVKKTAQSGETIFAQSLQKAPGGKGANQALAAKRLGANVSLIAKIGKDEHGSFLVKQLEKDQVNTEYIFQDEENPTGMAIITVDDSGSNSIIVVPGSNMTITKEEIKKAAQIIKKSDLVIAQFETPLEVAREAFNIARQNGVITVLNPAPAKEVPSDVLILTDIIIPNETETEKITKIKLENEEKIRQAGDFFLQKGVQFVIITLGEKGAALIGKEKMELIPAYKVQAIDTTGAGDGFIGAVSSYLADLNYEDLKKAIQYGNKVSSLAVQKMGAQPSLPYRQEVQAAFEEE